MKQIFYISNLDDIPIIISDVIKKIEASITAIVFTDLASALKKKPSPDLIIINCGRDLGLVIKLCEELKKDSAASHIPIIVLLPHSHASKRIDLIHAGADEYVFKPFAAVELEAKIDTFARIKHTYDELDRTNKELKVTGERLKELMKMKNDLVSIASHDMKLPITNIGSFANLLINERIGPLNDKQRDSVKTIIKNTYAMLHLIDNLIRFFEIQDKFTVRKQQVNISEVLSNIFNRNLSWAISKEQQLKLNLPQQPLMLDTDKLRLVQVVENILHNALKYTPRGGIVELGAYLSPRKTHLIIYIRDTGIGIKQTHLGSIFQQFVKNHNFGTDGEFGLGLGLAFCKKVIKSLEGKITVESEPDVETTFYLKFRGKKS